MNNESDYETRPQSEVIEETENEINVRSLKEYYVFLKSSRAYQALTYFHIDQPAQSDNIRWLWAPNTSQQHHMLSKAFNQGDGIRVWVGNPHSHPAFGGDLVSRVYQCEIEFTP